MSGKILDIVHVISPITNLLMPGMKKSAPAAAPLVTPTRNAAAELAANRDRVSKRRGAAANLILGASGAESSTGGKTALGQ